MALSGPCFLRRLVAGLWSCPWKELTGFACPGCGTTRAALALARLEPLHALTHYPLPALGWIFLVAGGLVSGGLVLSGKALPRWPRHLPVWARVGFIAAVLLNWGYSIVTGV